MLDKNDLKTTYFSYTGVRIMHIPTGIVVEAYSHPHRSFNRQTALAQMTVRVKKVQELISGILAESVSEKLCLFAERSGLRHDWHEPDNQGVACTIEGNHLDNAMGNTGRCGEFVVVLKDEAGNECKVNLATVLSLVANTEQLNEGEQS